MSFPVFVCSFVIFLFVCVFVFLSHMNGIIMFVISIFLFVFLDPYEKQMCACPCEFFVFVFDPYEYNHISLCDMLCSSI